MNESEYDPFSLIRFGEPQRLNHFIQFTLVDGQSKVTLLSRWKSLVGVIMDRTRRLVRPA